MQTWHCTYLSNKSHSFTWSEHGATITEDFICLNNSHAIEIRPTVVCSNTIWKTNYAWMRLLFDQFSVAERQTLIAAAYHTYHMLCLSLYQILLYYICSDFKNGIQKVAGNISMETEPLNRRTVSKSNSDLGPGLHILSFRLLNLEFYLGFMPCK